MSNRRGMALIQALLITAAIAAVAAALLMRANAARARLETRFAADQAALYLDSGVEQLRRALPQGVVGLQQDWARPREGVNIDRGTLDWSVADLQGRFNLSLMAGDEDGIFHAAFMRLATAQGLTGPALDAVIAGIDGAADPMPLVEPMLLTSVAAGQGGAEGWAALEPLLAVWPADEPMNVNTMPEAVLEALAPDLPGLARATILRRLAREPVADGEELRQWITQRMGDLTTTALGDLPLGGSSRRFVLQLEARLDSVVLRRSVVVDTGGGEGPGAVLISVPRP